MAHSEGTTVNFFLHATNPDYYREKVNLFMGLGPITRLTRACPLGQIIGGICYKYEGLLRDLGIWEILSYNQTHELFSKSCNLSPELCKMVIHFAATTNSKPYDMEVFKRYFNYYPSGSSVKCAIHYM